MINLAVVNNRFSIENGDRLKSGIKELFKINNNYDRSYLADYMLQDNDEYLNNIKEAVKVLAKKDDKLCLNIR